jgi:hypothetical protein
MWLQVEPLYKELHTYVRNKLLKIYDGKMDGNSDLMPAHILGKHLQKSNVFILIIQHK